MLLVTCSLGLCWAPCGSPAFVGGPVAPPGGGSWDTTRLGQARSHKPGKFGANAVSGNNLKIHTK